MRVHIKANSVPYQPIFAHQGFCVYKALAHNDMITCISTERRAVYNDSFHWLTKLSVLDVSHYTKMNNKTSVKLNWRCFKNRSTIGRIESVRIQSD